MLNSFALAGEWGQCYIALGYAQSRIRGREEGGM